MTEKELEQFLIVDWKEEKTRTRKSKPGASDLGRNELLSKLSIDVHIPEPDVPELALEIDAPEAQVRAAALEALNEDELPDWTDTANELLGKYEDQLRESQPGDVEERRGIENRIVVDVVTSVEPQPDAEVVRDYVREQARAIARNGEEAER